MFFVGVTGKARQVLHVGMVGRPQGCMKGLIINYRKYIRYVFVVFQIFLLRTFLQSIRNKNVVLYDAMVWEPTKIVLTNCYPQVYSTSARSGWPWYRSDRVIMTRQLRKPPTQRRARSLRIWVIDNSLMPLLSACAANDFRIVSLLSPGLYRIGRLSDSFNYNS